MTDIDMQWSKVHYIMNSKNYMKFLKASLNRYVLSKDFLTQVTIATVWTAKCTLNDSFRGLKFKNVTVKFFHIIKFLTCK